VTICAKDRKELFGHIAGDVIDDLCSKVILSEIGEVIENAIHQIPTHYPMIAVEHHIVMPNHVHVILEIEKHDMTEDGRLIIAPTISVVVKEMKSYVTKMLGFSPWQKSFHDHIIRDEEDYFRIVKYIHDNPSKWEDDCFYIPPRHVVS
jgi:REP element-mobilizing transposase RayT